MKTDYKPEGYNSVSPYFVVDGAGKLMSLLVKIFDAEALRKYDMPDGTIMHAELRIDDSILMFGDSSAQFPPNQLLTHIYVPDVDQTFKNAMDLGCEPLEIPTAKEGDPDCRGSFGILPEMYGLLGLNKLNEDGIGPSGEKVAVVL